MSEREISVTAAAKHFGALLERTVKHRESTVLLKRGKAVARLVPMESGTKTGKELAGRWTKRPHLSPEAAAHFEADLAEARRRLPPLKSRTWE